jgi:Fur family ferric uptake transcriptional regulator
MNTPAPWRFAAADHPASAGRGEVPNAVERRADDTSAAPVEAAVRPHGKGKEMPERQTLHPPRHSTARHSADHPSGRSLLPLNTPQQKAVLRALAGLDVFASAQGIHRHLRGQDAPVSLSTVYRTLATLEHLGLVDAVRDSRGEKAYRRRNTSEHQHYPICRQCGYSVPIPCEEFEEWLTATQRRYGFVDVRHMLTFEGLCRGCRDRQATQPFAP